MQMVNLKGGVEETNLPPQVRRCTCLSRCKLDGLKREERKEERICRCPDAPLDGQQNFSSVFGRCFGGDELGRGYVD